MFVAKLVMVHVCGKFCEQKKLFANPPRLSQTRVPHATVPLSPSATLFTATGDSAVSASLLLLLSSSSSSSSPSSDSAMNCCAAAAPHATTCSGLNCVLRCALFRVFARLGVLTLPPDLRLGGCAVRFIHSVFRHGCCLFWFFHHHHRSGVHKRTHQLNITCCCRVHDMMS